MRRARLASMIRFRDCCSNRGDFEGSVFLAVCSTAGIQRGAADTPRASGSQHGTHWCGHEQ